jgi:hypothetical protein
MDADGVRLDINGSVIANGGSAFTRWAGAHADSVLAGSRTIIIETPWGSTLNSTTVLNAVNCPPFMISGPVQFGQVNLNNIWDPAAFPMDYTTNERWIHARDGLGTPAAGNAATIADTFATVPNNGIGAQRQDQDALVNGLYYMPAFGTTIATTGGGYDFNGSDSNGFPGGTATAQPGPGRNTGESTQMQDLVINGRGFRGVSRIELWDTTGVYSLPGANVTGVTVDFNNTAVAGISCNYAGTQITITGTWIHDNNHSWARQAESIVMPPVTQPNSRTLDQPRHIRFFTGDGTTLYGRTPNIDTNATAY